MLPLCYAPTPVAQAVINGTAASRNATRAWWIPWLTEFNRMSDDHLLRRVGVVDQVAADADHVVVEGAVAAAVGDDVDIVEGRHDDVVVVIETLATVHRKSHHCS